MKEVQRDDKSVRTVIGSGQRLIVPRGSSLGWKGDRWYRRLTQSPVEERQVLEAVIKDECEGSRVLERDVGREEYG